MNVSDILKNRKVSFSFEIFPPKVTSTKEQYDSIEKAALTLSSYKPDFMSITYGAGGGGNNNTCDIAAKVQKSGTTALAHLTCINATHSSIRETIEKYRENGISNILALRGDMPKDSNIVPNGEYVHSNDLIKEIKTNYPDICVGAACYPEGHPESQNRDKDLDNLKLKVDAGVDFLTTQMFFDNDMLYSFLYRAQSKGINVPVLAGIMPVTNAAQIKRIISLSNAYMPKKFFSMIDYFGESPEALRQAGIAYATEQIIDLIINGVRGIHIYTMNKPEIAKEIMNNLGCILKAAN